MPLEVLIKCYKFNYIEAGKGAKRDKEKSLPKSAFDGKL